MNSSSLNSRLRWNFTWREVRNALLGTVVVFSALGAAMASSFFARRGQLGSTIILTALSLLLAAIAAFTVVPALFRSARLEVRRFSFQITREGWGFLFTLFIVGLAAFNTNNNLLFIVFSAILATLVVSGMISRMNLAELAIRLDFPLNIDARQEVPLSMHLHNLKRWIPVFSILVKSQARDGDSAAAIIPPVYFPYLPPKSQILNRIHVTFPRRGLYQFNRLRLLSSFPFGFVRRMKVPANQQEVIVLPERESPEEFYETLPLLSGAVESWLRGEGSDLYSIRDYSGGDNARFIDWRATAKTGQMKMREFTREDERKCCFVFDNFFPDFNEARHRAAFEGAVRLCANAARHFHEMDSEIRLLTMASSTGFAADDNGLIDILRILATIEPDRGGTNFPNQLISEESFKIIFTARSRGVIPTPVWNSAHVIFIRELATQTRELTIDKK
jgi:uncharacterized protein (DUF58 family)